MRILGIDPGLTVTGLGLLDATRHAEPKAVEWLVIRTDPHLPTPMRLRELASDFAGYLEESRPDLAVIEKLFFKTNTRSAMQVAEARGVILSLLQSKGIEIVEATPLQLKMNITGDGQADKLQMKTMVQKILNLPILPTPADAADGLALALYGHYYASTTASATRR